MIREMRGRETTITEFDEKLWRVMVDRVIVGTDGSMKFVLRNKREIEV